MDQTVFERREYRYSPQWRIGPYGDLSWVQVRSSCPEHLPASVKALVAAQGEAMLLRELRDPSQEARDQQRRLDAVISGVAVSRTRTPG